MKNKSRVARVNLCKQLNENLVLAILSIYHFHAIGNTRGPVAFHGETKRLRVAHDEL